MLPPNGHLEPLQSKYFFKEHVTVTCDPGYLLQKVIMQINFKNETYILIFIIQIIQDLFHKVLSSLNLLH